MQTHPGIYAGGLIELLRGDHESVEARAAAMRLATCLIRVERTRERNG